MIIVVIWNILQRNPSESFCQFFSQVFLSEVLNTRIKKTEKVFDSIIEFVISFSFCLGWEVIFYFSCFAKHFRAVGFYSYKFVVPQFITNSRWDVKLPRPTS